jgi:release factor glutamine methyltransferase
MAKEIGKIWTILDLIHWGKEYFEQKGIDSPRLTIELLLCHTLHISRVQLYVLYDRPLAEHELSVLREYCGRRAKREPLQYVIGKSHFYGLEFDVNNHVLIPRPETEILVDTVLQYLQQENHRQKIIDIGTGSGCIPITIASKASPEKIESISGIDISAQAITIAKHNAEINNVTVNFSQADIFKDSIEKSTVLISNPPYMSSEEMINKQPELSFEPHIALTDNENGLKFYTFFAINIHSMICSGGAYFFEIHADHADIIKNMFIEISSELHVLKDLSGLNRVIWGRIY